MQSAKTSDGGFPTMHMNMTQNFFEFVVVKLVLEVFGAGGAVWGCSEGELNSSRENYMSYSERLNDYNTQLIPSLYIFSISITR